jgi:iron complex outermembrane receptor protein
MAAIAVVAFAGHGRAVELNGAVRDEQGLLIPGAQVRVSPDTGATTSVRTVIADSEGRFKIRDLPPGRYALQVLASGFERKITPIEIPQVPAELVVQLAVAGVHEGVVVTATRQEEDSTALPLPTALVSDRRLTEQLPTNLAQGLDEVPGVTWVNAGAFRSRPVIRGLDSNRILVRYASVSHSSC